MTSSRNLLLAAFALLVALAGVYANHFDNAFAFDDAHTIRNNVYIRSVGNIPRFFVDSTTFSSNPSNQMYRPLLPALYSIDYRLAGSKLDPFWFHVDSFFWYAVQLILMLFFFRHLFERARPHRWNSAMALAATAFYGFHAANAETINYISARSDSLSTCWVIIAFVVYFKAPALRRHGVGLFMVPLIIASLAKPTALVFPALLFLYVLLFEREEQPPWSGWMPALRATLPTFVLCGALYIFQDQMTPDTFTPGGTSRFHYLITQPFVLLHYFGNFILPTNLAADTDLHPLTSLTDHRLLAGVIFIMMLLGAAWMTSKQKRLAPISFGILWFLVALTPTSSIIPLAEVTNDHRTFFPYIGLVMAVFWGLAIRLYDRAEKGLAGPLTKSVVLTLCGLVIVLHAIGVHARNEVWHDDESLWRDVVAKRPQAGRGWMNYGLAQMARGRYAEAETSFSRALQLWPRYSYAHINMGILKSKTGRTEEADGHFRTAIALAPANAEGYYFYARHLSDTGRTPQAIQNLETNLRLSPAHSDTRHLLMNLYRMNGDTTKARALAQDTLRLSPGDEIATQHLEPPGRGLAHLIRRAGTNPSAGTYLDLSLEYYRAGQYESAIKAARQAIMLDARNAIAHNNICASYNNLGRYADAIDACEQALALDPAYALARNNLDVARMRAKNGSAAQ